MYKNTKKRQRTNVSLHGTSTVLNNLLDAQLNKRIALPALPPNAHVTHASLGLPAANLDQVMHNISQYSWFGAISTDCLSHIVNLLSGDDVEALYTCGNHRMNLNLICGGIRNLNYIADGGDKIRPIFAQKCIRYLQNLEVSVPSGGGLDSAVGYCEWYRLIIQSDLKSLHIRKLLFKDQDVLFLPQSLTSFILHSSCTSDLSDECVAKFPCGLRTLHLGFDTRLSDVCFVNLPRQLTSFEICSKIRYTSVGILNLPLSLTHLKLGCAHGIGWFLDSSLFNDLPRSLLNLILDFVDVPDDTHFLQLPPDLKLLEVCYFRNAKGSKLISHLPRSLTHLSFGIQYLTDDDLSTLPPSLNYLEINRNCTKCAFTTLSKLPQHLKTFILTIDKDYFVFELTMSDILRLPPTLTRLEIGSVHVSEEYVAHLPRSITTLHIGSRKMTDSCASHLPPNLYELCLYDGYAGMKTRIILTNAFLQGLPLSVVKFTQSGSLNLMPAWSDLRAYRIFLASPNSVFIPAAGFRRSAEIENE